MKYFSIIKKSVDRVHGSVDLMGHPARGGPRWARPENENKTGNHMGFNGAQAELRWAVEKFLFKI